MHDGSTRIGKTKGPAIVWAGYALIEVGGWPGYWTVQAVKSLRIAPPYDVEIRSRFWPAQAEHGERQSQYQIIVSAFPGVERGVAGIGVANPKVLQLTGQHGGIGEDGRDTQVASMQSS